MIRSCTLFMVMLLIGTTPLSGAEILFAGITRDGAPVFEREFDRVLRENLLSTPGIGMVEYESAKLMCQKIDLNRYPVLSSGLVERMTDYIPDTTVLVWGRIRDYKVRTVRKNLLWASATADITITLNIYSLRFNRYAFSGDLTATAELSKGLIWFYPVDKLVHLTSTDKADLTTSLVNSAATRGASMIGAVVRSEIRKVEIIEGARRYEDPAVSKMFDIPSMKGQAVDSLKKASPPGDSASTSTQPAQKENPGPAETAALDKPDNTAQKPAPDSGTVKNKKKP